MNEPWKPWAELGWSDEQTRRMQAEVLSEEWVFRPRDEFDVDPDPRSLRGRALTLMDETDAALATLREFIARLPWYRRWPIKAYMRLKRIEL